MSEQSVCELCGEPMPPGEEMFKFHGYSGPCPQPPLEKPKPPRIVCLCGSTRFYRAFQEANYRETMAGKVVLSVGFYPHSPEEAHGEDRGCTPEQKVALDKLHKHKIDLADEVLVLNVGGYIGSSTRSEVDYAIAHGKPVRWLEPDNIPAPYGEGRR